ncbi:hypothetical protein PDIG_60290 [Penicillium digitatum PHI26]|uniref:Uncharacterized protein n=2 Tax=Penicillium digitatum TaxID=36651 RepID=K9G8W3_PEND2|nr:hypothetical protein PDIP_69700 [Penicillium digitatum Pd1]EKV08155.1 hypothetical protein PDIP_69700 [Penicillium digitatum Pd1]EKV09706.1 hypothetical protein PDIG_60290 [Penicillium digitatum PHI26]
MLRWSHCIFYYSRALYCYLVWGSVARPLTPSSHSTPSRKACTGISSKSCETVPNPR